MESDVEGFNFCLCTSHKFSLSDCQTLFSPKIRVIHLFGFFKEWFLPAFLIDGLPKRLFNRDRNPSSLVGYLLVFVVYFIVGIPFSSHRGGWVYKLLFVLLLKCDEVWEKLRRH